MMKYPKYKDSKIAWLRDIPEHWEVESFKNILTERNEKNNPVKNFVNPAPISTPLQSTTNFL